MKRDQATVLAILVAVFALAFYKGLIGHNSLIFFGVAIPSIVLHEISHGVAALGFGDKTAKEAGRITLNPVSHVDLLGTIILPALLALSGHAVFGYAKPVPINPNRMNNPRNDTVFVSLAGPATNVVLAVVAGLVLRQQSLSALNADTGLVQILYAFGTVNVVLAVFNLIPIPPLDGSSVVERFLPKAWLDGWGKIRRYGFLVLVAVVLIRPALLSTLFNPATNLWNRTFIR